MPPLPNSASRFKSNRPLPQVCFLLAAVIAAPLFLMTGPAASSQTTPPFGTNQDDTQSATGAAGTSSNESSTTETSGSSFLGSGGQTRMTALSSDQIISILEQNPDLLTELKSQIADQMAEQGDQVDASDISDATLYNQIATNARLRANITTVLRARGLITDDDLQSAGLGGTSGDLLDPLSTERLNLSQQEGSSPADAGAGARMTQVPATGDDSAASAIPFSRRSGTSRQGSAENPRAQEQVNASTDLPSVLHQPAPLNLESMRELYTQIPNATAGLKRFGADVFVNRALSAAGRGLVADKTSLDVPLGPDYVIGQGDRLTIDLWGGVTQSFTRAVDRGGRIFLPEAGVLQIAGLPLGKAESLIEAALKPQYRNAQVAVTISDLHSVRVYVVGDVARPGGYDISALATPLSALYEAGGPTSAGSLRTLRHYRGKQLVDQVDLYDFLLHGVRSEGSRFESGDTLLVPPAGPQIAISGAVRRPAIYELKTGENTLGALIENAGGLTAAASLGDVRIERIDAHQQRITVTLPDGAIQDPPGDPAVVSTFEVKDGDRIRVEPILPYSQRAVYLAGHVVRPGRVAYTDGMRLSDVFHGYQDLLPEPAVRGEIIRLVPPDLHAETIDFSVPDVLTGNTNVALQPFDTVRVFGRYQVDAPTVIISGEVLRPGTYPMSKGMTTAQLVRIAGGFKRDALLESADLTSYEVTGGDRIVEHLATVPIGSAVSGADPNADVALKPGDTLAIHRITNWTDIGQSVRIEGQVKFPGSYGFHDGERLSSVLRRAGGLLSTAYPAGAVLVRTQVKELEQSSRDEMVRQIEANSAAARLSPGLGGSNASSTLQLIKEQQDQVLSDLKSHPPAGRMVIHITDDIDTWANTPADIELRRDDVLTIPKQPGFVLITGQVYNATALTFMPGKTAGWYLGHAGGANAAANRKEIFIIRTNGSVVGRRSGEWFGGDVLSTRLDPGDVVVVPQKIIGGSLLWRNLLSSGQLAASVAITAGVAAAAL
jgi:protein involved in polysaccharide export with SLBB domain